MRATQRLLPRLSLAPRGLLTSPAMTSLGRDSSTAAGAPAAAPEESPAQQAAAPSRPPLRADYSAAACTARRRWAEAATGADLTATAQWIDGQDTEALRGNIEVPLGLAKVPVAVLGPLTVRGEHAAGPCYAPYATTEGALTASVMRGISAVNAGGGATVWTGAQHMTRGPCYVTAHPQQALALGDWVRGQVTTMQEEVVSRVSRHARLKDVLAFYNMEAVHLVFQYSSGDASGQNMATACTWAIMKWIKERLPRELPQVSVAHAWIENNAVTDKKPGLINTLTTRGIAVQASCVLPEQVMNKYLQISSAEYLAFCHHATKMTQRVTPGGGLHINPANSLAAIFIATGQDVAALPDSVAGADFHVARAEDGDGVRVMLTLPSLVVGTVGGGTALPTQREGLQVMGCVGAGTVRRFAEIVASFCLALDVSTSTALANGIFTDSHEKLGRNKPEHSKL